MTTSIPILGGAAMDDLAPPWPDGMRPVLHVTTRCHQCGAPGDVMPVERVHEARCLACWRATLAAGVVMRVEWVPVDGKEAAS